MKMKDVEINMKLASMALSELTESVEEVVRRLENLTKRVEILEKETNKGENNEEK